MKIIYFVVIFSLIVIATGFYYLNAYAASLPLTLEIDYCGRNQTKVYLDFRTEMVDSMETGNINPCWFKSYLKMLNIEHNRQKLIINRRLWGVELLENLNNQIKSRNLRQ